jgi:hypothetical protein
VIFHQNTLGDSKNHIWKKRTHGTTKIGCLYYVNPVEGERFYLRMLLMIVKGAQNFGDIKTYKGVVYNTFKEACVARGLLNNDDEWCWTFNEAASWASSVQLRHLFVTMLLFCNLQNERDFFLKYWRLMADDSVYQIQQTYYPIKYSTS